MDAEDLNEEQKQFMAESENEFKDRYTERDAEFMKVKNMQKQLPPIIDPWYGRAPRRGYYHSNK